MSVGYTIKYVHVKHESTFILLPFKINNNCYTQLRYYSQAKDNFLALNQVNAPCLKQGWKFMFLY